MKKNLIFILLAMLCIPIVSADVLDVYVRPKNIAVDNTTLQLSTTYDYTFNFSADSTCSNILLSNFTTITTDAYGIGHVEIDITLLSEAPSYLCEYRDGNIRRIHEIGDGLFNHIFTAEQIKVNNITTSNNTKNMTFWTNAIERMRITDSGLVGIGTSSPAYQLELLNTSNSGRDVNLSSVLYVNGSSGRVKVLGNLFTTRLYIGNSLVRSLTVEGNELRVASTGAGGFMTFYDNHAGANLEVVRITNGNVGIGTAVPGSKLTVWSGAFNVSNSSNTLLYVDNNTDSVFLANPTGKVGIGTTSPAYQLELLNTSNSGRDVNLSSVLYVNGSSGRVGIRVSNASSILDILASSYSDGITVQDGGSGDFFLRSKTSLILSADYNADTSAVYSNLIFKTEGSERVRITESNVGINTASPGSKLTVYEGDLNISNSTDTHFFVDDSNGYVGIGTSTPGFPLEVSFNNTANQNISIWAGGNISATGYITRTSKFDKSVNVWDYIKDSDYYLTDGKIDHSKFYGYVSYSNIDYSRPETKEEIIEVCEQIQFNKTRQDCHDENVYETVCHNEIENVCEYVLVGSYYEYVCNEITNNVCNEQIKQNCNTYFEEECSYVNVIDDKYNYVCENIEKQNCVPVTQNICNNIDYTEYENPCHNETLVGTIYPHKTKEEGVSLNSEIDLLRQSVFLLKQEIDLLKAELCSMGRTKFC